MEFISKKWTYLLALGSFLAYAFDKFYTFWSEKKKKQQAYNRTFVAIVKLFYSYEKHKNIYQEIPHINLPNDIYSIISKHVDIFDLDLESFKESILKESEIIPEISIESHVFFELANRIRIMDKMSLTETIMSNMTSEQKLMAKRAQFYSVEEVFDDFFKVMIEKVSKHSDVEKKFLKKLSHFRSEEQKKENYSLQRKIMYKYLESLLRQNAFSKEEFDQLSYNLFRSEE